MNDDTQTKTGDDLAAEALASSTSTPSSTAGEAIGESLIALQNIIERNATQLDRINEELKIVRESLKNVFENDPELSQVEEEATLVTQKIKERKSKIKNSQQVLDLQNKVTEFNAEKKELQEALNNHLLNLFQITGTKTFDMSSGEQREFSIRASLLSGKKSEKSA